MHTIRDVTFDLLRKLGLTTVFGNPGSTEETFLKELPSDFRYILALQEASAVAIADGYAQATRSPALVNVHTSAGISNTMSNIMTAAMNRTPLIVTAGNQTREMLLMEPWLTNVEPEMLTKPWAKWSYQRSGCGRTRGIHARLRDRHAATGRPGIPLDPAGRLGPTCGEHARGSLGGDADRTGPGTNRRLRPLLVQREEPGAHLRILDRPRGWLGTSGDSCREARRTRLGCAVLGAATVPRAPPPVPGWAAVRHRPACRPPGRPRRRDRHRRTRVPLLPVRRGGSTCPRG